MAFVNEYVSPEDAQRYDLEGIFKCFDKTILGRVSWTIDREQDVFMIWLRSSREESRNYQMFAMWWKGSVFPIYLIPGGEGRFDKKSYTKWQLMELELPDSLIVQRREIIVALKEALTEYTKHKLHMPVVDHTVMFEF